MQKKAAAFLIWLFLLGMGTSLEVFDQGVIGCRNVANIPKDTYTKYNLLLPSQSIVQ